MASNLVKAIRIEQHGGPEVLKLVEVEVLPPAANEVTIEQHAAGLNFIDIYFRTGLYPHPLPHGLGFEAAGVVTAVGADVKHLKKGDRVAYGQSPIGAYAKARNVPANQVVKVPKGIGFDEAAALMLKGLTVQYLFRQTYRLQGGENHPVPCGRRRRGPDRLPMGQGPRCEADRHGLQPGKGRTGPRQRGLGNHRLLARERRGTRAGTDRRQEGAGGV